MPRDDRCGLLEDRGFHIAETRLGEGGRTTAFQSKTAVNVLIRNKKTLDTYSTDGKVTRDASATAGVPHQETRTKGPLMIAM